MNEELNLNEPDDDATIGAPVKTIDFSPQQVAAMDAVAKWHTEWSDTGAGDQVFRLFGYAGTGKTTIARALAALIQEDHPEKNVVFGAYTGKAASVLRAKGCPAATIHGLIYKPEEVTQKKRGADGSVLLDEKGREQTERKTLFHLRGNALRSEGCSMVVIDECSMVGEKIGRDLLSFGVPILVLGDPAQLPPVEGGGFFTNGKPDVLLTEIHRQREGCGILDIATTVRTLGAASLRHGSYDESGVEPLSRLHGMDHLAFDQIIVGRNATRRAWNEKIRARLGRTGTIPVPGDKLICLRNSHSTGLMNGEQVTVVGCEKLSDDMLELTFDRGDGRVIERKYASRHYFEGREGHPEWSGDGMLHFDFGYVITGHKSQGSQWDNVLVIDESRCFREHADRWLYTAVTRAARSVTVVR